MGSRRNQHELVQPTQRKTQVHPTDGYYNTSPSLPPHVQRTSLIEPPDLTNIRKSLTKYNNQEYQLMPVEIEKDAEIGLVIGQIEGEQWVFIDEVLPNGMIDINGTLKEGDYLIQAGLYSLIGLDVPTALVLIERAYDEGRTSLSFVAARQQKSNTKKPESKTKTTKKEPDYQRIRNESRARSFIEYENEQEGEDPLSSQEKPDTNNTQF